MFFFSKATIELYEGTTQTNSTVWSSFDAPPLPTVEQQAYIIPAQVVAMKETITEKGITNKHVLSMFNIVLECFFLLLEVKFIKKSFLFH